MWFKFPKFKSVAAGTQVVTDARNASGWKRWTQGSTANHVGTWSIEDGG